MSNRILAIDIQQEQIISVLLNYEQKSIRILDSVFCTLPARSEQDDEISPDMIQALAEISAKIGSGMYDRCLVSIPANLFFFRTLELPFKNSKKIRQIIPFEMENHLALEAHKFDFNFCIVNKNNNTSAGTNMISIAAIEQDILKKYKTFFSDGGISPDVLTLGSGYPMALVFAGLADQYAIFIYAESLFASIYIIYSGQIAFCRSFALDSEEPESNVKKNLIYTYLSFNEHFKNRISLNCIAISGTAPFLDSLAQNIETHIQEKVQVFNIFEALDIWSDKDNFNSQHYDMTQNAIALAEIEIKEMDRYNFNPKVSGFTDFYQEHKSGFISSMLLLIIFLIIYSVQPLINVNLMEKHVKELDKKIIRVFQSDFPQVTNIVDPVHQMQVELEELKKKRPMDLSGESPLNIDIFNEISKILPATMDIIITRFVRTENILLVSGSADQFNTIDKMKNYFEKIVLFKNVDINSASMDKIEKRVKFNLKILL
jgi:general secretion pathway protein L